LQDTAYATRHGMAPTTWLSLVIPLGGPFRFAPEFNQYAGVVMVLAALAFLTRHATKTVLALWLVAFVGLVLASGDRLPVLAWLADHLPGFGAMRYPSRYGQLVVLALTLAGALGLSRFTSGRTALIFGGMHVALLGWAAISASINYQLPPKTYWDDELREDLAKHGLLPPNGVPPRIAFDPGKVRANSGMVHGFSTLDGFANPMLRNVWISMHREAGVLPPAYELHTLNPALYDHGPFPVASASLTAGWNPQINATIFRSPAAAFPRLQTLQPDGSVATGGRAEIMRFERNVVNLNVTHPTGGFVLLAEAAYPGWRAMVNGHETPVDEANGWMRRIAVPPGHSTVRLSFYPRHLLLGWGVSLTATILWCSLCWRTRWRVFVSPSPRSVAPSSPLPALPTSGG
jgi:hypothetical protein